MILRKILFARIPALFLAFVCSCAFVASASAQQPKDVIEKIFADWEKKQAAAATIKYVTRGEHVVARGAWGEFPPADYRYTKNATWVLDFKNSRLRIEFDDHVMFGDTPGYLPLPSIHLYDGERFQRFYPQGQSGGGKRLPAINEADLIGHSKAGWGSFLRWTDDPVFIAHGSVPILGHRPEPGRLHVPVTRGQFVYEGKEKLAGQECVVLKNAKPAKADDGEFSQKLWIDPSKESAVVRWLETVDGKPLLQFDLKYKQTKFGWVLEQWTSTMFRMGANPGIHSHETLNVLSFQPNAAYGVEMFQQKPLPGMKIIFVEKEGVYRMNDDGTFTEIPSPRRPIGRKKQKPLAGMISDSTSNVRWAVPIFHNINFQNEVSAAR
jgi:hypothetical protein